MNPHCRPVRTAAIAAVLLTFVSSAAFAEQDLMGSLRDGTIGNDFFVGDWCLVSSERDGDPSEPNLLFRFLANGPLNFEKADTGEKLHYGSWKLTQNMMMLRTTSAFGVVGIKSISDNEFTLGGKFGYTFRRGACK